MKAIMVMFDSLNRRMLPPYGCEWVHAPNFTRLYERTVRFDNCYVGSMPCMPARRDLHTGRYNFLHRSWGPLEPFDRSMPELLDQHGIYTHLVSDHYHYWEDGGATYHNRYTSWDLSRGQEGDPWRASVADPAIPPVVVDRGDSKLWRQDWVNRQYITEEARMPQAVTFEKGINFIRDNYSEDNWFLQIETFDPHEPFFTQPHYKNLYPHDYTGDHFDWPPYRPVNETPDEVEHVRYEYAALVSMCDHYLGKVMQAMDAYNLWNDTLLIVCTDHGFLLGEHDWWGKIAQPFYNEVAQTPLFIWDPRSRQTAASRTSLVQMIDFAPTLLDYFGAPIPPEMQGHVLAAAIAQDTPVREGALFGVHGGHVNYTDGRYVYMRAPAGPENGPLYEYTMMPTHMDRRFSVAELRGKTTLAEPFSFTQGCHVMQIAGRGAGHYHDFGTLLFDLHADPAQQHPIADSELEAELVAKLVAEMQASDAPPEQYTRLGLA
jgi:arylsulfatase A-like enzyme